MTLSIEADDVAVGGRSFFGVSAYFLFTSLVQGVFVLEPIITFFYYFTSAFQIFYDGSLFMEWISPVQGIVRRRPAMFTGHPPSSRLGWNSHQDWVDTTLDKTAAIMRLIEKGLQMWG